MQSKYEKLKKLSDGEFKWATGVKIKINREISKKRILIENVIGKVKIYS
ncbi:MAG: hypothetical protein ACD_7C00511G0014 [uncultured bacterium]|nr:MAG: hypothetical protein ACD_7C00511G0014 [uncultured bacterium]